MNNRTMPYFRAILLGCLCLSSPAFGESSSTFLHNGVTAHRGNSSEFPENTIPAFQSAIEMGADWIELDIFRTQDGKLVVIHDNTTKRVGDKNLNVPESTYAELASVDVATDFRNRTQQTLEQCPPQHMPLLADVLLLVMKQNRTRVSIQPKMDCVTEAVQLIHKMQATKWVAVNDGKLNRLIKVKELDPTIPIFYDLSNTSHLKTDIQTAKSHGFEYLVPNQKVITPTVVNAIKAAGLKIGAWTVNDQTTMTKLLQMGVDRIYTDHPRQLLALVQQDRPSHYVTCEGSYKHHLQGFCATDSAIFWSFTTQLVKTDRSGKVLASLPVAWHHGDVCIADEKLYVAVNLGKFNDPKGNADSWVYVYNSHDLSLISKHPTPEVFHGAGGIGVRNGHFYVVGGLPDGVEQNFVYEYDGDFKFIQKHTIESGHTRLGIQATAFANDRWWFGCYGNPQILLVTDPDFKMLGRYEFNCSLGIDGLPDGQLLVAGGKCQKETGCSGWLDLAVEDPETGLRRIQPIPLPGETHEK